ncbi:hypothetical protein K1T71_001441 [Dendrolimus kikuchii]|uniref:Uncharacterized protein n=1 Tax=Dendrolimus kikuchii TaxID=765133 RepID=A0ACC1DHT5_9NEOP|nr:hypothetical protein K1T71_001441 [Dendrolimus kikuchii]
MVVVRSFNDIFNEINLNSTVNLPLLKEHGLKINYCKGQIETTYRCPKLPLPFAKSEVYNAEICAWRRLTLENESCKAVYEVTFDVEGSNFEFKAGDTIGILPCNIPREVEAVLNHLDLRTQADTPYHLTVNNSIKGCKIPPHIPVQSTLRHVLSFSVDLRAVLKKLFLLALSKYTKDENERKILEFLCSKEGATSYHTHILNKNLTLTDIFQIFKTCKPPVEILLANLPRLLPRTYSIVNTGLSDPNLIKICFSVMSIGNNTKGLTTGWLEQLINKESDIDSVLKNLDINQKDNKVPIYLRKNISGFSLPVHLEKPMLFIGPGTGVAPYLGFLEEISFYKKIDSDAKIGEIWLYFGCRDANLDFIYKKELYEYLNKGILNKMSTAFSRMEDSKFKYVQDALINDGQNIVKLIKDGAHIFICGDLKTMAGEVKDILVNSLVKYDGKSKEEAEKYISDMQKDNRYLIDAWC